MPDVTKSADFKFRLCEPIERDQETRFDRVGMLTQRHVSQIQQPANFQIVGKHLEVFGEMADGPLRTVRIHVPGGR